MRRFLSGPLVLAVVVLSILLGASSCDESKQEVQRHNSINYRAQQFARAERAAPLSSARNINFPLRKALIEWNNREDLINHPWYVYLLGDNGNAIGYYVAKTAPISTCNFLSSTEDDSGTVVLTAPSIDGMFYGGAGATGGCGYFILDYATNAVIIIAGNQKYQASDQPLRLKAEPIRVKGS